MQLIIKENDLIFCYLIKCVIWILLFTVKIAFVITIFLCILNQIIFYIFNCIHFLNHFYFIFKSMGRTVDAYQWRLLFFKQCQYSWLLSKHYWCTIRSHCDKFWEESIELHYYFSRPFYGIDNTKSCSMLNLTTFDECGFYFTFVTCMDVHHFILSYWAITTSIDNYRHEVACCQVLWYICSMHTSYSAWKFPACVSWLILLSNFNSLLFIKVIHPHIILIWSSFYIKSMDSTEQVLKLWKECLVQIVICLRCWSISWFHFVDVLTKWKFMEYIVPKIWHVFVDEWFPKSTRPHWFWHVCGRVNEC